MRVITRKSSAMFLVIVMGSLAVMATTLRVRLALVDPHMALALEAISKPSTVSWLRGKTFLLLGADPDAPILDWGINAPPLVACVESGNDALARAIVKGSSRGTRLKAADRACESPQAHTEILRVLAEFDSVSPSQLCSAADRGR